ncbi:uncharacterized protein SCHCODRAFT_02004062 [Schizophyllum commune H4-8]|uniref:uncharacterized protein n=1 Tax=Schizophyllum commune (strain H4-8 / FGSC 9210) TaxID=578458 RepID=UPI00215F7168|nr:uncharacterized protein SCHCODRAFT_02004062 [Schizophyllum commune H4-8]KAI5899160.1 hypothetical protein SCHCODRAFT_02004062 [Schizophyllum commune H4-8]
MACLCSITSVELTFTCPCYCSVRLRIRTFLSSLGILRTLPLKAIDHAPRDKCDRERQYTRSSHPTSAFQYSNRHSLYSWTQWDSIGLGVFSPRDTNAVHCIYFVHSEAHPRA